MKLPFKLPDDKNTRTMIISIVAVIVLGCFGGYVINKNNDNHIKVVRGGNASAESPTTTPLSDDVTTDKVSDSDIYVHIKGEVVYPGVYKVEPGARINDVINMSGGITPLANINGINLANPVSDADEIIVPSINDSDEKVADNGNSFEIVDSIDLNPSPQPDEEVYDYSQNPSEGYVPTQGATSSNSGSYKKPDNGGSSGTSSNKPSSSPLPSHSPSASAKPSSTPSTPASDKPVASPPSASNKVNINTASASQLDTLPAIGPALAGRIIDYRNANGAFNQIADIMKVSGIGEKTFQKLADLICV